MFNREDFIKTALKLAERGRGLVSPNPLVGAVVAKGGRILGEGYHRAWGMPHAETEAIRKAKGKTKGASLYVNLEPCCHYGKTPPCTEAIIKAGIKEVICSMKDPNPLVSGKGIEELEKNGIKVRLGSMEKQAAELNSSYILNIEQKRPYVILKWAQTLDGKTATVRGDSKWITGESARQYVKKLRFEADGIIAGINTVLKDNPFLDYSFPSFHPAKMESRKRYRKIILDPQMKMPQQGNIWNNSNTGILIVTSDKAQEEKISLFERRKNCEVLVLQTENGLFDMKQLLTALYQKDIGIIIVEGGSNTITRFWEAKTADEAIIFCSSKILGDNRAITSIGGRHKEKISEAVEIKIRETKMFGQDIMIRGTPCFQE
ncbi:MAG TPA: bifunctional diaminohydroxyphosphoribosylaminopyrimidine deaminase/5-amino-6-(5-phosphoribosylamino)uracil reductase RibD [bacterium]|nr:bifunctional diaminohydroxyphosphoribosylaminopyrimidine deaminase/5-amino-6-(5-phosphoribosylamino)uracil reductase RibD [bacterium]